MLKQFRHRDGMKSITPETENFHFCALTWKADELWPPLVFPQY